MISILENKKSQFTKKFAIKFFIGGTECRICWICPLKTRLRLKINRFNKFGLNLNIRCDNQCMKIAETSIALSPFALWIIQQFSTHQPNFMYISHSIKTIKKETAVWKMPDLVTFKLVRNHNCTHIQINWEIIGHFGLREKRVLPLYIYRARFLSKMIVNYLTLFIALLSMLTIWFGLWSLVIFFPPLYTSA